MLPGSSANVPPAVMDRQNGHGNVPLVATGAFVSVTAVTDMKTRPPPNPAEQDKISNALKGHLHIFVARKDLSTSEFCTAV